MIEADLLIVGTGFAGLWAAITAADAGAKNIVVVDKGSIAKSSNASLTLGGTIYLHPEDDKMAWMQELVRAADHLSRQDMWDDLLTTSYSRLKKLESWGLKYTSFVPVVMPRLKSDGNKHVALHHAPKWNGLHAGRAVAGVLADQMLKRRGIRYFSKTMITKLLTQDGRIAGAIGVHRITASGRSLGQKLGFWRRAMQFSRWTRGLSPSKTGDGCTRLHAGATLTNGDSCV